MVGRSHLQTTGKVTDSKSIIFPPPPPGTPMPPLKSNLPNYQFPPTFFSRPSLTCGGKYHQQFHLSPDSTPTIQDSFHPCSRTFAQAVPSASNFPSHITTIQPNHSLLSPLPFPPHTYALTLLLPHEAGSSRLGGAVSVLLTTPTQAQHSARYLEVSQNIFVQSVSKIT